MKLTKKELDFLMDLVSNHSLKLSDPKELFKRRDKIYKKLKKEKKKRD